MGVKNFHKRASRNGRHLNNGDSREKIIRKLRRVRGVKLTEARKKAEVLKKKLINRFIRLWNKYATSDSFTMQIMRYQRRLCTPDLKSKLDAKVRKKRPYLETEINLTEMQITVRPSIRDT